MTRVVFMGSAELACSALDALARESGFEITGVVTQPDRPAGRGRKVLSCPVKKLADGLGLKVFTPENVNTDDSIAVLSAMNPDIIVVVAYGQILRTAVLNMPPLGCVNLHASLLPKYRGAAPIQWAIARGETITGVTSMYINEKMDAGDMILQKEVPVAGDDTAASLCVKLADAGADLLVVTLHDIINGSVRRIPQVEADATFAPKLKKDDGRIDWRMKSAEVFNRVRGFYPWPCCWCNVSAGAQEGHKAVLKILKVAVEVLKGEPGAVIDVCGEGPVIGTIDGSVRLLEVQPEGGKIMSGRAYMCGHVLKVGEQL